MNVSNYVEESKKHALLQKRSVVSETCKVATWGCLVVVLANYLALRWTADVTWWGTVAAFAPRWVGAVPLVVLVPAVLILREWRLAALQTVAGIIVIGPVMGLTYGGGGSECPTLSGLNLRVMTCNVQGSHVDSVQLGAVIAEFGPDIVTLQECPSGLAVEIFKGEGWSVRTDGALCIASRYPITKMNVVDRRQFGGWGTIAQLCDLETPQGAIRIVNVHLMTVRPGLEALRAKKFSGVAELEANIATRRRESSAVRDRLTDRNVSTMIAGDFNLPVDSVIYRDKWFRYTNAFSAVGNGFGHTWNSRWHGIRIDHVLVDSRWKPICCRIGPDIGSDHRPLLAELRRR